MNFCSHGPSSKGWAGKELDAVVLAGGLTLLAPLNLVLRAGPGAPGPPSLSWIPLEGLLFFEKEVFPSTSPLNCSWRIRNSHFLEQSTILYGDQGLGLPSSCLPPLPTSLEALPPQTGGVGLGGPQSSILWAEGIPWVSGGKGLGGEGRGGAASVL